MWFSSCSSWRRAAVIVALFHSSVHAFSAHSVPHVWAKGRTEYGTLSSFRRPVQICGSPSLDDSNEDPSSVPHLNVIIPAYNEETRIGSTLQKYSAYLDSNWPSSYGIMVIDDGSKDACAHVVHQFAERIPTVCCISLSKNGGKGAALGYGVSSIIDGESPQLVLTADADGSADLDSVKHLFTELRQLVKGHWETPALVVGYRTYDERAFGRLVFRWGFRSVVRTLYFDLGCSDTQCGFKLMTLSAARPLYSSLHLRRWSHDVEVLLRAGFLGVQVSEAPVRWVDKQGSKLVDEGIFKVTAQMFLDVIRCRLAYLVGVWKVER